MYELMVIGNFVSLWNWLHQGMNEELLVDKFEHDDDETSLPMDHVFVIMMDVEV
jgi:hypothetical protein